MNKTIDYILKGREKGIGAETVLQPLPHKDFRFANPFIVLHHLLPRTLPPGSEAKRIPPHPHRGFAPVTFLFQGEGFHRDSRGNSGVVRAGGVQWMFAGKGLLHSEGPTSELLEKGGTYEFVQLWVNVPKAHKLDEPTYQQAGREEMPALFPEPGIDLRLVSGTYQGKTGPFPTFSPILAVFGSIEKGKSLQLTAREGDWTLLYILGGSVLVNDNREVPEHHLAIFSKAGTEINLLTTENTRLVYLSAEPIAEPVAAKGNIVMNTKEEVEQAEQDIAAGRFGELDY